MQATRIIPVVFLLVADPSATISSKASRIPAETRPDFHGDPLMSGKWLELLQGDRAQNRPRRHYFDPRYDWIGTVRRIIKLRRPILSDGIQRRTDQAFAQNVKGSKASIAALARDRSAAYRFDARIPSISNIVN